MTQVQAMEPGAGVEGGLQAEYTRHSERLEELVTGCNYLGLPQGVGSPQLTSPKNLPSVPHVCFHEPSKSSQADHED